MRKLERKWALPIKSIIVLRDGMKGNYSVYDNEYKNHNTNSNKFYES